MALRREGCVEAAWECVGRKVAKQQSLEGLYEMAHTSLGFSVAPDSRVIGTFQLRRYLTLTEQRSGAGDSGGGLPER